MTFRSHLPQSANMYHKSRYCSKIVSCTRHFQAPGTCSCLGHFLAPNWGLLHGWLFCWRPGKFPIAFLFVHTNTENEGVRSVTQTLSSPCNLRRIHQMKPRVFLFSKRSLRSSCWKQVWKFHARGGGEAMKLLKLVDYHKQSNQIGLRSRMVCVQWTHCYAKCPEC